MQAVFQKDLRPNRKHFILRNQDTGGPLDLMNWMAGTLRKQWNISTWCV